MSIADAAVKVASRASFAVLDPTLRALLASIERGRQRSDSEGASNDSTGTAEEDLELDLKELRSQAVMLRKLRENLASIDKGRLSSAETTSTSIRPYTAITTGLLVMAEYVMLPLTLILQETPHQKTPESIQTGSHDSLEWRKHLVRRSAGYTCIEQAALCMSNYVELVSGIGRDKSAELESMLRTTNLHLENEMVVQCLRTCTMALANLDESRRYGVAPKGENSQDDVALRTDGSLDRGDDCLCAILRSVEYLFLSIREQGSAGSKVQADVASSLGGTLIARLVAGCLSALGSVSPTGSPSEGVDRNARDTHIGGKDIRGNVVLRLQALASLRAMITGIPEALIWRSLLPGTFAALFRLSLLQLRFSTAQSSPKVAAESISILSDLLNTSLSQEATELSNQSLSDRMSSPLGSSGENDTHGCAEKDGHVMSAAVALRALASRSASSAGPPTAEVESNYYPSESKTDPAFIDHVNQRLPAPLVILMRLVSKHKYPAVRRTAAVLYSTVLVQTRAVWTEDNSDLKTTAMECCLSLTFDSDECARSAAERALVSYQECTNESAWRDNVSSIMAPRVVELIEGLPLLARGMRGNELRNQIDIICGYFQMGLDVRFGSKKQSLHAANRKGTELGKSLARVASIMRKSLGDLFRPDYDLMSCSPRVVSELIISRNLAESLHHTSRSYLFLRDDDAVIKATRLLRLLGSSLGEKQGSLFIDGCIAQMFNAREGTISTGRQHSNWLDQFCGLIVVVDEVLVSSFSCSGNADEPDNCGQGASLRSGKSSRREAKKAKLLFALASSIIPIITSPPIWSLPTTIDMCSDKQDAPGPQLASAHAIIDLGDPQAKFGNESDDMVSVSLFRGNAAMQGCLLSLIGNMCQLLGRRTTDLLPTILLPLLEKTGASNHNHVQQTAIETLDKVAKAMGTGSIASLVSQNFDYVVESLSLQLRSQTGAHRWATITSVLFILLQSTRDLQPVNDDSSQIVDGSNGSRRRTALLFDLVDALITSFERDLSLKRGTRYVAKPQAVMGLIQCFGSSIHFLSASVDWTCHLTKYSNLPYEDQLPSWLNVLAEFEESPSHSHATENGHGADRASTPNENDLFAKIELEEEKDGRLPRGLQNISQGVVVTKRILSRCCFFLSVLDLKIQVASCKTILIGFEFLSSAEEAVQGVDDESEGIGNPFLSTVSDCWPGIISRLRATCSDLVAVLSDRNLIHEGTAISTTTNTEVLFGHLLSLVAIACEKSGDFIARRYEEEVWPLLSKLLGVHVSLKNTSGIEGGRAGWNRKLIKDQTVGRDTALLALLNFMCRIFRSDKFGIRIAHLTLPLGVMTLPLLSEEGQVADAAVEMYKEMLSRDCDTLWRTLTSACGESLPSRIIKSDRFEEKLETRFNNNCPLAKKTRYLLEYADSLPEQYILSL